MRPRMRSASVLKPDRDAALAVGCGSGIGARAFRPDVNAAGGVAPGDRAAAGADLDDVDHRQLHRLAAGRMADHIAFLDGRNPLGDEARLGGGAAHVEADRALDAEQRREAPGPDHAGDRPRLHHRDRLLLRQSDRHHAAVGAHDADLAREPLGPQKVLEPPQIGLHPRSHEGVERGGRGALVFAVFAHDLVRQGDEERGRRLAQDLADAPLMRRIGIGMQEADRDGFDLQRFERGDEAAQLALVERDQDVALRVHALGELEGEIARDQRFRPVEEKVESLNSVAAADRICIPEAARGDERGARAFLLQHGVDRDGRAVQHLRQRRQFATGEREAVGRAAGRIGRHGRGLRRDDAAVDAADQVREGAADIDADDVQSNGPSGGDERALSYRSSRAGLDAAAIRIKSCQVARSLIGAKAGSSPASRRMSRGDENGWFRTSPARTCRCRWSSRPARN